MYTKFYGLKEKPFNITSDPDFFFESVSHREAFAALLYGIKERKGIILITGEVGTGKTTLCKAAVKKLPADVKVSLILNNYFSESQLLRAIVEDFGLKIEGRTRLDTIKVLNSFLIDVCIQGGTAVLIIDEAQNLSMRQLEQIRLLSNLETAQAKLLQIVLVGQPELLEKLNQYQLRQIRQRILVKYNIHPLKEEEIKDYVEFRLEKAGAGVDILPQCYPVIYEFSRGIPRLINALCDRVLLVGFVQERKIFDENIFRSCAEEIK